MKKSYLNIITVVFSAAFIFLLVSTYLTISTSNDLYKSYDWVEHTYDVINQLERLEKNLYKSTADARGYYIVHLPYLNKEFKQDTIAVKEDINRLEFLIKDNSNQKRNIDRLKSLVDKRLSISAHVWVEGTGKDTKVLREGLVETTRLNTSIYYLIQQMIHMEEAFLSGRKIRVLKNISMTRDYILSSALSIVLIGFLFILIVRSDIGRRRKHEAQLQELNDNKVKFFSIISHDLRGPAYAAQQLSEMIKKGENLSQEEKNAITGMMDESIRKVTALLDDLLDWSRLQMNQIEFSPQILNLNTIAQETIDRFHPILLNKQISIHNLIDDTIEVDGDKYMISTILRNLIGNAVKFTNAHKSIFISSDYNDEGLVEVKVKDEGVGINAKIKERLFKLGKRTSTRGTSDESGTGLGLILCKEFVEKQGGKIWVESEEGRGAAFIFTVPVAGSRRQKDV